MFQIPPLATHLERGKFIFRVYFQCWEILCILKMFFYEDDIQLETAWNISTLTSRIYYTYCMSSRERKGLFIRGVANGGAEGADCPPRTPKIGKESKNREGEKGGKERKKRERKRKEKREGRRERKRKGKEKEKGKKKRKRKGKEKRREERGKGRKGGEEKGEEREWILRKSYH